jgi:hypothetical protein
MGVLYSSFNITRIVWLYLKQFVNTGKLIKLINLRKGATKLQPPARTHQGAGTNREDFNGRPPITP